MERAWVGGSEDLIASSGASAITSPPMRSSEPDIGGDGRRVSRARVIGCAPNPNYLYLGTIKFDILRRSKKRLCFWIQV